jgi:enediyne biosynthesis protein E4
MFRLPLRSISTLVPIVAVMGCGRQSAGAPPLFKLLSPTHTGVTFANTITTNDSLNAQTDPYVYNGGGVAIGDIDNDGLPDIFFTGNMVSSRLYLNKGNMRFQDVTKPAGVTTTRWATGATMVDINNDGNLDIYVSISGPEWSKPADRTNLLFINNGDHTFTEAAARYGLADTSFTTHAVFLDYNGDGYLDVFLLNNSPEDFGRGQAERPAGIRAENPRSYNELYRNNGDGTFTNVSRDAGILRTLGYGLGVVVADLNGDGWPDIYVSNDITPDDVLYVNNGDGTFTDKAARWLKHTSFAGMGVDIADFNNDGRPDILQVDMMPPALSGRKRMSGNLTYGGQMKLRSRGFRAAYDLNSLQLNNGLTKDGDVVFSEIARLAGVAYTDWSWSALFGDFDNDGYKDIFITNGYPKAVNDFDYQTAVFRARQVGDTQRALKQLRELHSYAGTNYVFRNRGDLTFADRTKAWGLDQRGFSYGAAYGDLNNDGRLDVVVNNIDGPAFIHENAEPKDDAHHYLQIQLRGESLNTRGIGSTLILTVGGQKQYVYHSPYRGYLSTMDDREHFGLGRATRVDSLEVIWPDGRHQLLTDVEVDRILTVKQADATKRTKGTTSTTLDNLLQPFQPMDARRALPYRQETGMLVDYSVQPLLPYQLSSQGPPLAVGDVNGDGLEDVFIGGAAGVPGKLFVRRKDGSVVESSQGQPWLTDRDYEDWGALFFDANGDGLPDLYVASGGYQLVPGSRRLQDRLYLNKGDGRFVRDSQALPEMPTSTAAVAAGDFTGDGRSDLFVGGRLAPRNYPSPTRSYLLRNDGGHFTDVTEAVAPELVHPGGMITAAVWIDFDGDGQLDLVTAGEWMPLRFYRNEGARFRNVTASLGLPPMRGWWYSLASGDFNHDGRPDLVAGNLGLNYTYTTSEQGRFGVSAADFTGNGTSDVVLTQETDGTEYPFFGLAKLGPAIYPLAVRFPSYGLFSEASVPQLFSPSQLQRGVHYQTDTFASVYLQNNGAGTFTAVGLPPLAQISPIKGIIAHDVDGDGNLDLIVAGNLYDAEPNTPRADAGNGLWLKGDGRGHFAAVPPIQSGFLAPLDVTGLALINTPAGKAVLVANHGDSLQAFVIRRR